MADIIKVEHLSYVYNSGLPAAVTALDDVSFTRRGRFCGLIGATGSGKAPITHMNGLNKPISGKIYIDGHDSGETGKDPGFPLSPGLCSSTGIPAV